MKNRHAHIVTVLSLVCVSALLISCVGYRVGSMLPNDIKTVHIPTFINGTPEPLIEVDATAAAIQEFQLDGSLKLADKENADAIMIAELTDYRLEAVSFDKDNRYAANQYRIIMEAKMTLRRTSDDTVIVQAPSIVGTYLFVVSGDLSSSKLMANPFASRDLAKHMIQYIVEYW